MRIILVLMLVKVSIFALVFDFVYLDRAKDAYNNKDYDKAANLYKKVDKDAAKFNVADSLYRQKKYKEALSFYKEIEDEKLSFKKLHNIGNSYAKLGKIDEAIKAYEDALNIQKDEDTEYNLKLLKKKKEQKKKEEDNSKKQKDNKSKDKENKNSDKNSKQDKREEDNSKKQKDNKSKDKKNKQQKESKNSNKSNKLERDKKIKQQPISNIEERKWQKMLNQRGVNTLLLPLNNKGEKNNEKNPW